MIPGTGVYQYTYIVYSEADGNLYGIPDEARQVLKFHPIDHSATLIGPELLGNRHSKYDGGVCYGKGCIYCAPCDSNCILKIDTINGTVIVLNVTLPVDHCGS